MKECSQFAVRASLTLRIDLFADLQRVRVGEVSVGGRDGQDQAVLFGDELQQHVSDHTHTHREEPSVFQSGTVGDQTHSSYLIWNSMSVGWSPTATFVMPGRSISVRFKTEREKNEFDSAVKQRYRRQ